MRIIKCARCGEDTVARGPSSKYCPECAYKIRMEKVALFREALNAARGGKPQDTGPKKTKIIKCKKCGVDVEVPMRASRAKFCPKCAEEAKIESVRRSRKKTKEQEEEFLEEEEIQYEDNVLGSEIEPWIPRESHIEEINAKARAAGMSYGKYRAMLEIQKQQRKKKRKKVKK